MVNYVPYVLTCPTYLVPLLFSYLTYYVTYIFQLLTWFVPNVFSCLTCPFCLLLCGLHVLISIFLLFLPHASRANFLFNSYFRGCFWKFTTGRRLHFDVMIMICDMISDMICLNYFQKKYPDTNLYSECLSTYLVFDRNSCLSVKLYWSKLVIPPTNFQFRKFLETFACS